MMTERQAEMLIEQIQRLANNVQDLTDTLKHQHIKVELAGETPSHLDNIASNLEQLIGRI